MNKPVYLALSILEISKKKIAEDVESKFYNSNYQLERPLPKRKKQTRNHHWINHWINERWIRWKNDEKIVGLRAKAHSYLVNGGSEEKKQKAQKRVS